MDIKHNRQQLKKDDFYDSLNRRLKDYSIVLASNSSDLLMQVLKISQIFLQDIRQADHKYKIFGDGYWGYGLNYIDDGVTGHTNQDIRRIRQIPDLNKHLHYSVFNLLIFKISRTEFTYSTFSINLCSGEKLKHVNKTLKLKRLESVSVSQHDSYNYLKLDFSDKTFFKFQTEFGYGIWDYTPDYLAVLDTIIAENKSSNAMEKKTSRINIKNVKGNVVVSEGQQGGVTTHDFNPEEKEKSRVAAFFQNKYVQLIGLVASLLGIFGYFGFQPDQKKDNVTKATDTVRIRSVDTVYVKSESSKLKNTATMEENKDESKGKDNPISIKNVKGDVVISQNQTGGITAHTINYKTPPRQISQAAANELITQLKKHPPESFRLHSIMNNSESYETAQMIEQILKQAGWNAAPNGIMQKIFNEPQKNIIVEIDKRRYASDLLVNWFLAINFKPIGHITPVGDTVEIIVGENL